MAIAPDRLRAIVDTLAQRPGHENVRALVRELCVVGLEFPDSAANFEVQVPEVHGRIDAIFGNTIFEFKRDLRKETPTAEEELARYLKDRESKSGRRYLGIATDGATFVAYQITNGNLVRLDNFVAPSTDPRALLAWLDGATAVRDELQPDPDAIRSEFGRDSLVYQRAMDDLRSLWQRAETIPEAALKHELWQRHLEFVYGTLIEPQELFLQHTYLTIIAKTMALRILTGQQVSAIDLLSGVAFAQTGLHGAVEADFFDWTLLVGDGPVLVERIAAQIGRFRLSDIDVDVLKAVYESLIDPRQRHYLGEYYTPDWLARWTCERAVPEPLQTKVFDPSCGSGAFLFVSVRRFLEAADAAGWENERSLQECTEHVLGLDVHPVAVLFARVTYLLAMGPERLAARKGKLSIPVYLGDALQWDVRQFIDEEEVEIAVPGEAPLRFPGSVAGDPVLLDTVLRTMREFADQGASARAFQTWLGIEVQLPEADRRILVESYDHMRELHAAGRNHIWSFIVRNLTRPLWLSIAAGKPDVVVGNPPWLRYSAMSAALQQRFRSASIQRGLWEGGALTPHHDLSGYFLARASERYLGSQGRIAFVMPLAVLTRGQFAGFRTGRFSDRQGNSYAVVRFDEVWSFDSDVSPLFEVPSCVIFAHRSTTSGPLPSTIISYAGRLPRRDATTEQARRHLTASIAPWPTLTDRASVYRDRFKQGATIVPRRLFLVEQVVGSLGVDSSAPLVTSRVGSQDKSPWRDIEPLRGQVESRFLRPILLGESIAPYRVVAPSLAVVPYSEEDGGLLNVEAALELGNPYLAAWLRKASTLWDKHSSGKMTFDEQIDYFGKLSAQFPIAPIRVVYAKAGKLPAAAVVRDTRTIIDHKLYWSVPVDIEEGTYLTAILNSEATRRRYESMQSRGQWGARDIDKVVFRLPIPSFDAASPLHKDISQLGLEAEIVALAAPISADQHYLSIRRIVRRSLDESGISERIERLVDQLLP